MSLADVVSAYNRRRKWRIFLKEMAPTRQMRVLDVGFSEREYRPTDNYLEKHYPYPESLTALGIDVAVAFQARYPGVAVVRYGGNLFPFQDQAFDLAWSNAVIEHVGDRDRQVLLVQEIKRVAKRAFLTTPNRFFPVEVHTHLPLLHYLPKPTFDRCLRWLGKGWAAGDYMHLLSRGEIKAILSEAGIVKYRILPNRICGFAVDFVILF